MPYGEESAYAAQAALKKKSPAYKKSSGFKMKSPLKQEKAGYKIPDEVVSTTSPGSGWTKIKGTNIWQFSGEPSPERGYPGTPPKKPTGKFTKFKPGRDIYLKD